MLNVGDTVTIKVLNALWEARDRYANGWVGPKYTEYTGTVVHQKWYGDDKIGLTTDMPHYPVRVIDKARIIEVMGAKVDYVPVKSARETITVKGSKGKTYIITKENGKTTCTCTGYQFRKTCKHVQGLV